jgi:hypothetical protein
VLAIDLSQIGLNKEGGSKIDNDDMAERTGNIAS